jgi:hypothetical protein
LLKTFRLTAGSIAVLLGTICLFWVTRTLIRVGWPEGFKASAYLWFVTLTVPLPVSLAVNLVWEVVPWRCFAGGWLIAFATIHCVGIFLAAADLRAYRFNLTFPALVGVPFLAFLSGGLLLLLIRRRP